MDRRTLLRLMGAPAALVGLGGWRAAPTLSYNPNHYQNNDPLWDKFNQAQVNADYKKGLFTARFPASLSALANQNITIAGFILPLEASTQSAHFTLVRRNTGCPFCPPNAPTEAVEIFANNGALHGRGGRRDRSFDPGLEQYGGPVF